LLLAIAGVVVVSALAVTLAVVARDDDGGTTAPTTSSETESTPEAEPEAEESATPVELEEVPDETGALRVRLPVAWDQRDTRPLDDGLPDITASTDIENFFSGYETSGMEMTGFRINSPHAATYFDPTSRVSMSDMLWFVSRFAGDRPDIPDNACGGVDSEEFERAGFHGLIDTYSDCGDTGSTFVVIAAANADETIGIDVEMVLTDAGERAALDEILDSFVAEIAG
jgi:hypothetical protein